LTVGYPLAGLENPETASVQPGSVLLLSLYSSEIERLVSKLQARKAGPQQTLDVETRHNPAHWRKRPGVDGCYPPQRRTSLRNRHHRASVDRIQRLLGPTGVDRLTAAWAARAVGFGRRQRMQWLHGPRCSPSLNFVRLTGQRDPTRKLHTSGVRLSTAGKESISQFRRHPTYAAKCRETLLVNDQRIAVYK
jgi:hypothetical protein